jgi:hypothetical protein
MLRAQRLAGLALCFVVAGGCSYHSTVEFRTSCLDACRGALADADLSLHVGAWSEFQASFSDVIAADKSFADAGSTLSGFVQSLVSGNAGLPGGFKYQGNGVVSANPTSDATVDVRFYLASATSYGKAGDPITFNVFDPANYFQGLSASASVSVDLSGVHTSVQLQFTKAGPGAELLGLGSSSGSPLTIDVGQLTSRLGTVGMAATSTVDRANGATVIRLQAVTAPQPANTLSGSTVPLQIQGFSGTRSDLGQVFSLGTNALSSVKGGVALDGTALVRSASPSFSFQMLFSFPSSALADVVFGCPSATLTPP